MRRSGVLLVLLALLGASSCGTRHAGPTDCRDYVASPAAHAARLNGNAGAPTGEDYQYVCFAGVSRLAVVAYGLMAEKRSANPAVRGLTERLVGDNKQAYAELDGLARQQDGMVMPTRLDEEHVATRSQLSPLTGDAFDRAYLQLLIAEDQEAIRLQHRELKGGEEPFLKRYAVNSLKRLQGELASVQQVAAEIGAQ